MLVTLTDAAPGMPREQRGTVNMPLPAITVRELIRARVELEREALQDAAADRRSARWLTNPGPEAPACNDGGAHTAPHHVAPQELQAMVAAALAGFERGRFFVLVNDRQVTGLDDAIALRDASEVTFLRLVALQGG